MAQTQPATSATPAPAGASSPSSAADYTRAARVEEVVVTGSRLNAAGFNAPTPVSVLSAAAIDARAPVSIAQVLYDIPAFTNNGPTKNTFGSSTVGMNQLNLRNLGAARTLVLVDGRRYVPSSTTTAFDTNLIPTGLVQRAEVVTGGASAAYGSDAVAGVVNIILNDKMVGLHGSVQGGRSDYGDDNNYTANIAGGMGFANGKGHVVAGAEYSRDDGVGRKGVGPYARPWGRLENGVIALGARPAGTPANVVSQDVEFANVTPGGIIVSGPLKGTAFNAAGQPYAFSYGTLVGTSQMTGSTANYGYAPTARQPLEAGSRHGDALLHVSYELNDNLRAFVELNYGQVIGRNNTGEPQFGPGGQVAGGGVIIAGPGFSAAGFPAGTLTNPFLPAATAGAMTAANLKSISIGRLIEESGPFSTNNTSETRQVTVGVDGKVFGNFTWNAYYEHGANHYTLDVPNVVIPANFYAAIFPATVGGQTVCGTPALNAINPNLNAVTRGIVQPGCVPFDIFGPNASAAAVSYIKNHMFYHISTHQDVGAASLAGSPFSLWAGPVSLATGFELRRNAAEGRSDALGLVGGNLYGNYQPFSEKSIDVEEGFLEVGAPLARDLPFAKSLDLNGAVRETNYSTSGTVTTWKLGGTYEPVQGVRFRLTRSQDIRAPNLGELYASTGAVSAASNPYANNVSATLPQQTVGSAGLIPEVAQNWTGGVVLQPAWDWASGLRLSVDYFQIDIANVITTLPVTVLQAECFGPVASRATNAACSGYFQSYDPSVADTTSPNYGKSIGYTSIRVPQANLNHLKTSGFDIAFSYRAPLNLINAPGRLDFTVLAQRLSRFDIISPNFNAAGQVSGTTLTAYAGVNPTAIGGGPKWKGTLNINYLLGNFSSLVQLQGFNNFEYSQNLIGPDDSRYTAALSDPKNPYYTRTIDRNLYPGALYVNISAQYNIINHGNAKLQLFGDIDNLLDKDPPFGWVQTLIPYETIGRTFRAGIRFDY